MPLIFEALDGVRTTRGIRLVCNGYVETHCRKSSGASRQWPLAFAMGGSWGRGEPG
jgi:hypothetical protein